VSWAAGAAQSEAGFGESDVPVDDTDHSVFALGADQLEVAQSDAEDADRPGVDDADRSGVDDADRSGAAHGESPAPSGSEGDDRRAAVGGRVTPGTPSR